MIDFDKDKAYMEVLRVFRNLMNTDYKFGGWLPPVRDMCKRLNVSNVTYTKATKRLVAESMAESFPGKGIYVVPQEYRPKKVGLVVGNGEESPFFNDLKILHSLFRVLDEKDYCCHLIQGNSISNIVRSAISHCVAGLIWIVVKRTDFKAIRDILNNKLFPIVCIQVYQPSCENEIFPEDLPHISGDYTIIGEKQAKPFIKRGHKKIAVAGENLWHAELTGLASAFRDVGIPFGESDCIPNPSHNPGIVTRIITKEGATGIIINGNAKTIESVFKEISLLPNELQPEVMVGNVPMLSEVRKKYPGIKIIALCQDDREKYGKIATEMLLGNLEHAENIVSRRVEAFRVSLVEQFTTQKNDKE